MKANLLRNTLAAGYQLPTMAADFGCGFATVQRPAWSLAAVCEATRGRSHGGRKNLQFRAVVTDSRQVEPGDLFVALIGDRFDGHDFVAKAVARGAAGVVVSRTVELPWPVVTVQVADTLVALGDLAAYRRRQMDALQVVAITGSSGKTTVKEMVAAIATPSQAVLKTQGNYNNLIGLPLSLLPVDIRHRLAILEMGMNRPGEIRRLTAIANPDIACITNVQPAHLQGLATLEGVAAAKGELFVHSDPAATLVVNFDDPEVRRLARIPGRTILSFGRHADAWVRATHIRNNGLKGMAYTLHIGDQRQRVVSPAMGPHSVTNGLAAAAICHGLAIPLDDIVRGLGSFASVAKRSAVTTNAAGIHIIDDTYNANPGSMAAALATVAGMRQQHRCAAVLGDMLELGEQGVALHRQLGQAVAGYRFDYLLLTGDFAGEVAAGARAAGMPAARIMVAEETAELVDRLAQLMAERAIERGDFILVKGSRGMRMERVIAGLEQRQRREV